MRARSTNQLQKTTNRHRALLKALAEFKRRYGRRKGVIAIGHGVKCVGERCPGLTQGKGDWAIVIYVEKKLRADELSRARRASFPTHFRGFPTDVIEIVPESSGMLLAGPDPRDQYRPLLGGVAIGLQVNGIVFKTGTGCLVVKQRNKKRLLTCSHVLFRFTAAGEPIDEDSQIVQPDAPDQVIGTVGKHDFSVDAGLVELDAVDGVFQRTLSETGTLVVGTTWDSDPAALPPETVLKKYGATTKGSAGRVVHPDHPGRVFSPLGFVGPLVQIEGIGSMFANGGDSGAPVYAEQGNSTMLVGILVGIEIAGSRTAYAVPISEILLRLKVTAQ